MNFFKFYYELLCLLCYRCYWISFREWNKVKESWIDSGYFVVESPLKLMRFWKVVEAGDIHLNKTGITIPSQGRR